MAKLENLNIIENNHKRIHIFLRDHDWKNAIQYCEKCLDISPECSQTYIYYLLAKQKASNIEELTNSKADFSKNPLYIKALEFSKNKERTEIEDIYKEFLYNKANKFLNRAKNIKHYNAALKIFSNIMEYKNSKELLLQCEEGVTKTKKRIIKNIKRFFIIFFILVLILTMSFLTSFLFMKNQRKELCVQISALEKEKLKIENDFSPIQEKISPIKNTLENKKHEKKEIEEKIEELNEDIAFSNKMIDDFEDAIVDIMLDYGSFGLNPYLNWSSSSMIDIYEDDIDEYEEKIKKYKKDIKDYENKLSLKNEEVHIAQNQYDTLLAENEEEINTYKTKTSKNKKKIDDANKKIDKIDSIYKKFPYNLFVFVFKQ